MLAITNNKGQHTKGSVIHYLPEMAAPVTSQTSSP